MISQQQTVVLPAMSEHDAKQIASRSTIFSGYVRVLSAKGCQPSDVALPAAILTATHGLINETDNIACSIDSSIGDLAESIKNAAP